MNSMSAAWQSVPRRRDLPPGGGASHLEIRGSDVVASRLGMQGCGAAALLVEIEDCDALFCAWGCRLCSGFANTGELSAYATVNIGIEHAFKIPGWGDAQGAVRYRESLRQGLRDPGWVGHRSVCAAVRGAARVLWRGMNFRENEAWAISAILCQ